MRFGVHPTTMKQKQGASTRTHPAKSDMYNRAFPVGNTLFFFAGGMMSLLCLPLCDSFIVQHFFKLCQIRLVLLQDLRGFHFHIHIDCTGVEDELDVTMAQGSGIHSGCFYIFWMTAPSQRHMVSPA